MRTSVRHTCETQYVIRGALYRRGQRLRIGRADHDHEGQCGGAGQAEPWPPALAARMADSRGRPVCAVCTEPTPSAIRPRRSVWPHRVAGLCLPGLRMLRLYRQEGGHSGTLAGKFRRLGAGRQRTEKFVQARVGECGVVSTGSA